MTRNRKQGLSSDLAPDAIGTYSQAIKAESTVYISGQIPLVPATMEMVTTDIDGQIIQVFKNLDAICRCAGGDLDAVVKFTVYLTDLDNFARVNAIMQDRLTEPYPARAAVQVAALPKGALVEIDAIMVI